MAMIKEGDGNTIFFLQKMANAQKRENCLAKIRVNGN